MMFQIEKKCSGAKFLAAKDGQPLGEIKPVGDGTFSIEYSSSELNAICQGVKGAENPWKATFSLSWQILCGTRELATQSQQFTITCTQLEGGSIVPSRPVMCCDDDPMARKIEFEAIATLYSATSSFAIRPREGGSAPLMLGAVAGSSDALSLVQRAGESNVQLDDYAAVGLAFTYPVTDRWGVRISALKAQPDLSSHSANTLTVPTEAHLRAVDFSLVRSWPQSQVELFSRWGVGWQWLEIDFPGPGEQHFDSPTLNAGAGLTLPLGERWFLRPQVDARWELEESTLHWGVGVGLGLRVGSSH